VIWVFRNPTETLAIGPTFWKYSKSVISVPEPGTLSLFGAGVIALGLMRRRKLLPRSSHDIAA
jgi:hypothetical protein